MCDQAEGGEAISCPTCHVLFPDLRGLMAHSAAGSCSLLKHATWIQALKQKRQPTGKETTPVEPISQLAQENESYLFGSMTIKTEAVEDFSVAVPPVTSYMCAHQVT